MTRVVALVPARNEADRIAETVRALRSLDGVEEVVVVDDGSMDETGRIAVRAGARVLRSPRRRGKGSAMNGALLHVGPADVWLFADGDLAASAACLAPVLSAVLERRADVAIGVLSTAGGGGFGIVRRAAGVTIRALTGFETSQPLSGQRAITAEALASCRPLAPGFGLEVAMTVDAVRAGFRVLEVATPGVIHRPTGRTLRGFAHRGRQGWDILRAALVRALRRG